jgi:hypothetical protein
MQSHRVQRSTGAYGVRFRSERRGRHAQPTHLADAVAYAVRAEPCYARCVAVESSELEWVRLITALHECVIRQRLHYALNDESAAIAREPVSDVEFGAD